MRLVSSAMCWTCLIRIRLAHKTMQKQRPTSPSESVTNVNIQSEEDVTAAEVLGEVSLKARSVRQTVVETFGTEMDRLLPQEL